MAASPAPPPPSPPFLGDEGREVPLAQARVAILPCPYDGTSTYKKGADRGPAAALEASTQLETFDLELDREPCAVGFATLPPVDCEGCDPAQVVQRIEAAAAEAVGDGRFLLGLGGEHSVSVGLTRAARRAHGSFSVLQIDAHADLRASYEGSPYNHACVMRRLAEDDPGASIVSVGVRACCREEAEYAGSRGIHTYAAHTLVDRDDWIEEAVSWLSDPVYVTVDLDGLDPSILPSTGTPVPGGLGWYQALALLRCVGESRRVVAADITELKPDRDNHHSEFLAAQLAYKMIGYFVGGEPPNET